MNNPAFEHQHHRRFSVLIFRTAGFVFLAMALAGCSLLRFPSSQPKAQIDSLQLTGKATGPVTLEILQAQVMRFADTYTATVAQSCDDISVKAQRPDVRLALLRWKLGQATSAYTDATGPNPAVNALDILVLVSVSRMVVEDYGVQTYGDTILPLLETQRNLETNAWTMARGLLKPSQEKELRDLIQQWRQQHPNQRYVGQIRFREFVAALGKTPTQATTAPTSIFSLLYLDPLAGLDPTAAAIQETRELGERAMYYTQRMPILLSWQTEVLAYQLAAQPESQQVLKDAERISAAAEIFAKTGQQLPQLINDQRQAAIQQVFDGLSAGGNQSSNLLSQTRQTLNSATAAAASINAAVQSLDAFVRYVAPTNASPATTGTNSQPFNVNDYGNVAAQIGIAANNLSALLAEMNQSAPQMAQLSAQTTADAKKLVQHAFWLGLVLILILLIGSVVAGLAYRTLASKINRANADSGSKKSADI